MNQCPLCREPLAEKDILWADVHPNRASFVVHYTKKKPYPEDIIALCMKDFGGIYSKDFFALDEALMIGSALIRAVHDQLKAKLQV